MRKLEEEEQKLEKQEAEEISKLRDQIMLRKGQQAKGRKGTVCSKTNYLD